MICVGFVTVFPMLDAVCCMSASGCFGVCYEIQAGVVMDDETFVLDIVHLPITIMP